MTANSIVSYSSEVFNHSFEDWVQEAHKYNCEQNGWNFIPLKPGAYGYDSIVMSFHEAFQNPQFCTFVAESNIEAIASLVHDGWAINYQFWATTEPYLCNENYIKPYNPINDEQRNMCANADYEDLPEDEKKKDRLFATFLASKVSAKF